MRATGPSSTLKRDASDERLSSEAQSGKRQRLNAAADDATGDGDITLVEEPDTSDKPSVSEGTDAQQTRVSPAPRGPGGRPLQRHDKFFYEDGSVVVQVGRTLFRLHKTLLSSQSSFFRELFADAYRPAEDFEAFPGATLPFYVLSVEGLRVSDFEQLLEAADNSFRTFRDRSLGNNDYGAIARAAHALKFTDTHAWAADELHQIWPSDFASVAVAPEGYIKCAATALQIAKDANVPQICKGAFYELLRTKDFGQDDEDPLLSIATYNTLTRARQFCAAFWMTVLLKPPPQSTDCQAHEKNKGGESSCAARGIAYSYPMWTATVEKERLHDHWIDPVAGFDALRLLELENEDKNGICDACFSSWKDAWTKKAKEFWDELDEPLGLTPTPVAADTQ
ncbi:hypothetical protein PENSPDRAFT_756509 [Peniophora sp. CONT]|nr:hypothetical protein PENSPDRAFT_756509 [Peniophora sp. CONT]